jgi:hypothetical protein
VVRGREQKKGNKLNVMTSIRRAEGGETLKRILLIHVRRYPGLQPQDVYKLIYQAAMGCEHAVQDVAEARSWLEREVRGLREGPKEPAVDPIAPDGRIVRINLRPYLAERGDLNRLSTAFVQTATRFKGSMDVFQRYLSYAEEMAVAKELAFSSNTLKGFLAKREAEGYPAVHHSDIYRQSYRPAYRVVYYEFLLESNTAEV